jgi:hypothetical protein
MISLSDLKLALRIDEDDTSQDAYMEDLEVAAVASVERYTGRYFGPPVEDAEIVVQGDGSGALMLGNGASEVTGVASRAYAGGDLTEIETGAADGWSLRLDPGATHGVRLVRHGGGGWPMGGEFVVTATIGYAAGDEPADVRQSVIDIVAEAFENRVRSRDVEAAIPQRALDRLSLIRRLT